MVHINIFYEYEHIQLTIKHTVDNINVSECFCSRVHDKYMMLNAEKIRDEIFFSSHDQEYE